jgi:adenylate cyclase
MSIVAYRETVMPTSRNLFFEEERRAETILAILRIILAVLLTLVLFLATAPMADTRPPPAAGELTIAFTTLSAWLGLGVLSFALARPRRYRPWMAWPLATADITLILGSLQFALANMAVPASFAAVFPVVWVAPLVLTFGALRYNPWLQAYITILLTAGLAIIGWTDAVSMPFKTTAPPSTLTILFNFPPNLVRLVMLTLAGTVLVVAAVRARTLLRQALGEAERRANLTRYLPPQIADRLAEHGLAELRQGRRQRVAVLFCDLRGFTTRAEHLDPLSLADFVTEFRRRVTIAASATDGIIDKFIGDAALIVFGLPDPSPNDARHALTCAHTLLRSMADWNRHLVDHPVTLGIGIHYGDAFCGVVGDNCRLEFTVLGDTVNIAARLEQLTKAQNIPMIVSEQLLCATGENSSAFTWISLPSQPLRGRMAPLRIYGQHHNIE